MRRTPKQGRGFDLHRAVGQYLKRFFTTRSHLRRLMVRRARKYEIELGPELDQLLDKLENDGILDDRAFAEGKVRSLRARGKSTRWIRSKLYEKGVPSPLIAEVLAGDDREQELISAARTVRKRRLGPYRDESSPELRRKDLARLGRAGFRYEVARNVLDMPLDTVEDLSRR